MRDERANARRHAPRRQRDRAHVEALAARFGQDAHQRAALEIALHEPRVQEADAPARTAEALVTTKNIASDLTPAEDLPARALRAYVGGGALVDCLEGELWVTGPGIDDVVLGRGQSVAITKRGKVVVQALSAARLRVRPLAD